jgi:hypothetical protein
VAICEYRGKHSIRLSADPKSRFFIHSLQQTLRKFLKGYSQLATSGSGLEKLCRHCCASDFVLAGL